MTLSPRAVTLIVVILVAATIFTRFWSLTTRPGLEWDEPVYYSVASNLAEDGSLAMKLPVGSDGDYLYHPPFYFVLLASWFGIAGHSLGAARTLSAGASIVSLGLLYMMLRSNPGGRGAWVLVAILAADGWLVFSARIALIDNLMLVIAIGGLLLYRWAYESDLSESRRMAAFVAAGVVLGAAATFKHTGAYVLLILPIHWVLVRRYGRHHLAALAAAATIIVGYLAAMTVVFGNEFWTQYGVQLSRALGIIDSRGSVVGQDVLRAITNNYAVFAGTIVAASSSVILVAMRLLQTLRDRNLDALRGPGSLYLAWTLAALMSFGLVALRFPQYLLLVLIPLFIYSGSEAMNFVREHRSEQRWSVVAVVSLLIIVAALNSFTFGARIVEKDDNAMLEAVDYLANHYTADTLVLTEEPIGVLIPQPYLSLELWALGVNRVHPTLIVTYSSLTQELPQDADLVTLIGRAEPIIRFEGFKETITVYELDPLGRQQR